MFDVAHGASLAAVWGSWAEYLYQEKGATERFAKYARNVWNVEEQEDLAGAKEGIKRTVDFFREIGMPVSLTELKVPHDDAVLKELAQKATLGDTVKLSRIRPLGAKEAEEIYRMAVEG